MKLNTEHIAAVNQRRRIIFQDDVLANDPFRFGPGRWGIENIRSKRFTEVIDYYMCRLDGKSNQIDSVWYEWGEGNTALWPSKVLPCTKNVFPEWWEISIDPIRVLLEETKKRGREVFFS